MRSCANWPHTVRLAVIAMDKCFIQACVELRHICYAPPHFCSIRPCPPLPPFSRLCDCVCPCLLRTASAPHVPCALRPALSISPLRDEQSPPRRRAPTALISVCRRQAQSPFLAGFAALGAACAREDVLCWPSLRTPCPAPAAVYGARAGRSPRNQRWLCKSE